MTRFEEHPHGHCTPRDHATALVTTAEPQIIPTNAGLRTFASPPEALQEPIVPNDLFYIRNHWKICPDIDVNSYRLTWTARSSAPCRSPTPI